MQPSEQNPDAVIAGLQQLLGAESYRRACAESAAQQLVNQLNEANAEIERLKTHSAENTDAQRP